MGVTTTTTAEFKSSISAARMYKALLDNATLFPKIIPQYKSEFIQGDGGVGSIRETSYPDPATNEMKSAKHRVDAQDAAEYYGKYTLIEGGPLGEYELEAIVNEVKIEAAGEGCILKATNHFHAKGEANLQTLVETIGQQSLVLNKAVEAYLLTNPNAYD